MKRAIVTITCGDLFQRMAAITHPLIKAYADRLGADFIVWDHFDGHSIPDYQKLELGELLDTYERVLYLDTDILVRDDAPDIFQIVPEDSLGMMHESQYLKPFDRIAPTIDLMKKLNIHPTCWNGKYYNAGVIVLSQAHRRFFARPEVEWDNYAAQTYLNVLIATTRTKVFSLPYQFNRIYCMDSAYGDDRFASYFMHYAGLLASMSGDELSALIERDLEVWRQTRPAYQFAKHLAFVAEGDMGQQICAEPALRYAREVLHPQDDMVIVSERPELFLHLGLQVFPRVEDVPGISRYRCRHSLGNPTDHSLLRLSSQQMHGVNFVSLQLLGTELPLDYKTPRLPILSTAIDKVRGKLNSIDAKDVVVIHPAASVEEDTFPANVWQSYADVLVEQGIKVAIVGTRGGDFPVVEFDRSRYVDLVDRLDLSELIALIARAPIMITCQSPLAHVAGAAEHWLALIAPARHPEYILHWRNASQYWRVRVLQKAPRYDSTPQPQSAAALADHARLSEFLPSAEDVLSLVRTCVGNQLGVRLPQSHAQSSSFS